MIEWADIGSERKEKNYDEWAIEYSQEGETSKEATSKTKRKLGVRAVAAVIGGIEG